MAFAAAIGRVELVADPVNRAPASVRLPFMPNKDVVFVGLAVFLVGSDQQIVAAMTLMATLILAAHLVVGALLALSALAHGERAG